MKKKSFFLIFSLWLFFLLSLFCLGLGFRTYISVKKTKLFLNRSRAFYLAVSGIKMAQRILYEDEDLAVDFLGEEWAKSKRENINFSSPKKEGVFSVIIEDECSRININEVKKDKKLRGIFLKLLENRSIDDAKKKIDFLLDYIDKDEVFSRSSQGFGAEDNVKNEKLSAPEELLLIEGFTPQDYEKIKDFITVFTGDTKLNINTLNLELLDIFVEDEYLKSDIFEVRLGSNLIGGDEDDKYYGDFSCTSKDECYIMPIKLKNSFKINSKIFRIISEAEVSGVKKKIVCVVDRSSEGPLYKILYWHEE